jgi:hypothetical protein
MLTKSNRILILLAAFLVVLAVGCTMPANGNNPGGTTPTPGTPTGDTPAPTAGSGGETISGLAQVDSVDIRLLESFPVQVQAIARGNLPDGCTTIDETLVERSDTLFRVTITTTRPAGAACTEALVPFEQVVSLDVLNLPAGQYTVDVNGVTSTFELAVDNIAPTQEVPTSQAGDASISGIVWHDLCAVSGGEAGVPAVPSSGCIQLEDGSYQANGIMEEQEPRLEGIEVSLGQGGCPAQGLATTKTDKNGEFTFANLTPGKYCVSVDAESLNNGPILIPGTWSAPKSGQAQTEVDLEAGQQKRGVFFGWDYENLPEPQPIQDESSCTNKLAFVEDISIPDDTQVSGGQEFAKVWKLRNDGTCTWTTGYAMVFASGDQMDATSPIPLQQEVAPGDTAELGITFTAPTQAGTYRSEWLMRSAFGTEFGTGKNSDTPFWVQVQVVESVSNLDLGQPTWVENFSDSARWFLVDSGNTKWTIDNGELTMESYNPGSFDEWGLSNYPPVKDFYLEATVRTGDKCSGLDRYGLLFRSPDPNQGYVYTFSCDGRYRLYGWDGNSYNGLQEWTTSTNIQTGPDKTNKIGILAEGDSLKLYANGSLLAELTDSAFDEGQFGLIVASGSTPNFKVYVQDVSLWER